MPSSNGVYSLPPGYLAVTGSVIQASQHNPPLEDIAQALTLRLSRDGSAPMTGPLQFASTGSVSAPSAIFANNASTGWYPTTNGIGISINGTKVAEFTSGGLASGARFLGELIPFTCTAAPALTVVPTGQTLSRTTYAALWAQAQIEIAAGNLFYNNGDGSTTFGIGDMRGRVPAMVDSTGGILDSTTMTPSGNTLGAIGGTQKVTLTASQLPSSIPYTDPGHAHSYTFRIGTTVTSPSIPCGGSNDNNSFSGTTGSATTGITINPSGGAAHNNMQPTLLTNYILFAGA